MPTPATQLREKLDLSGRLAPARQEYGEHDQYRHRADIDQDLRETNELGIQLQIERRETGKCHHQHQRAMHQVAQAHGGTALASVNRR